MSSADKVLHQPQQSITRYFYDGFSLANQSIDILLANLLFLVPLSLITFIRVPRLSFLLTVILGFIATGFTLSIPVFLTRKQQKKRLDYREVVRATLINTKRIILPSIVLFVLFILFEVLSAIILFIIYYLYPTTSSILTFLNLLQTFQQNISGAGELNEGWHPIALIGIVFWSLFTFAPFFFSLEQNGLLRSIKRSVVTAFKNPNYIGVVISLSVLSYSITSFIPIKNLWGELLRTFLGSYIHLVIIASSLFYYQDSMDWRVSPVHEDVA